LPPKAASPTFHPGARPTENHNADDSRHRPINSSRTPTPITFSVLSPTRCRLVSIASTLACTNHPDTVGQLHPLHEIAVAASRFLAASLPATLLKSRLSDWIHSGIPSSSYSSSDKRPGSSRILHLRIASATLYSLVNRLGLSRLFSGPVWPYRALYQWISRYLIALWRVK
jgi:hypothetical protein